MFFKGSVISLFHSNPDGKFGTVKGVLIPNILQMFGVILFMRMSWVLGHVGAFKMSCIITMSAMLLMVTGLSLSTIASNMKMRAGGAYYIISRTLGIELGSAIGLLIQLSQLCSISLCTTGFAVSLQEFLPDAPIWMLKSGTLVGLVLVSYFSTDFALKAQMLIFTTLAVSIGAIFFASGAPPEKLVVLDGAQSSLSFWMAFAMFFPAMTGIESGMAMSGDLRNPSRSLPIGTLLSILIVYLVYLGVSLFLANRVSLELLRSYPFMIYHISKVGIVIAIGIWSATLSSALGVLLGGPRIMQAVAKDGVLPRFLSKGYGPTQQPRIATIVFFLLGLTLTLSTNINQIIPILTMVCLISYGLINFIAFFESFIQNPSWRPGIKIPAIIPFFGTLGCFMAMFMINPGATFIVLFLIFFLYVLGTKRKILSNWDDLRHGIFSYFVHKGIVKLSGLKQSAKSWRPHILTIFDTPFVNKNLAFFSHAINQEKSFLTFATSVHAEENEEAIHKRLKEDLQGFKIPSYIHTNSAIDPEEGTLHIIQNYGFGLLKPNTVIMPILQRPCSEFFIKRLLETHRQEKNIVLLKNDAQKDYLFSDPTRKDKRIDLWWRGKYPDNFELSLAFAYLLQQSKLWPKAEIRIKTIEGSASQEAKLIRLFGKYQKKLRIERLGFKAIQDPQELFFPNLLSHSSAADLVFLGLKKPNESTSVAEYQEYCERLFEQTASLQNVAYVLCGEKVKFRKIFL